MRPRWFLVRSVPLLCILCLGAGCNEGLPEQEIAPQPEPVAATQAPILAARIPVAPLTLAEPEALPSILDDADLTTRSAADLSIAAQREYSHLRYHRAHQLQYWAVKNGGAGLYNLACFSTLDGAIEAGFYWLQRAATEEGVDADWAATDFDLERLRTDARWGVVALFLSLSEAYWAKSEILNTALVVPAGYQVGTPIGVVIGMHGRGAKADGFVDPQVYQPIANALNMAIVAVSGTRPKGPKRFSWSEDAEIDHRHLVRALKSLENRLTVEPGHVILFGFSQGAEMAFEVAWLHPEAYRGALVLSPGTTEFTRTVGTTATPGNKSQGYVCTCGGEEHPGNIELTKRAADLAGKGGARVKLKLYNGVEQHGFPADFVDRFADWIWFIDGASKSP